MISLNVLLTTMGIKELARMLFSLVDQLNENDYLTIVSDANHFYVRDCINNIHFKCPVIHIHNPITLGSWGHASRNKYQNSLLGDYIINADDDNYFVDGAFNKIREIVKENKVYVFRHNDNGRIIWEQKGSITLGNIDTGSAVIPNTKNLPDWEYRYGGDSDFYKKLSNMFEFEWIDYVMYKIKNTK